MIDPSQHADDRNFVERILLKVPGFKGYLEKEYRRESDHLTRTFMAEELSNAKAKFDAYLRSLVDTGELNALPQCERVATRIDTVINEMKGAVRGYSGVFDFVRVREDLLDQVYEHDMSLVEDVADFADAAAGLLSSVESPQEISARMLSQIDAISAKFNERARLLNGLGTTAS